jgi:Type IV secretion system pilin
MKKFLLSLALVFFSITAYAQPVSAQAACSDDAEFCALAPIPGLTGGDALTEIGEDSLANFLNNLYKYILGLAAVAAVIEIIWGGLEMTINRDNVSKLLESKGRISRAIQGLILVFAPFVVFSLINPAILQLKISFDALEPGSPTNGGAAANGETRIGQRCDSNDQCTTNYCNTTLSPSRCTWEPDASGDQCDPYAADTGSTRVCPAGLSCLSSVQTGNKYVCTNTCTYYPPPSTTPDCSAQPAALAEKIAVWCPTSAPEYNECKVVGSGSTAAAVCYNFDGFCYVEGESRQLNSF